MTDPAKRKSAIARRRSSPEAVRRNAVVSLGQVRRNARLRRIGCVDHFMGPDPQGSQRSDERP